MEEIKGYVYMLVCVLVASGLSVNLSPEGEIKKYIRYICLMCTAAAICIPTVRVIGGIFENIDDIDGMEFCVSSENVNAEAMLIEQTRKNISASICDYICEKYALQKDEVSVDVLLDIEDTADVEIKKLILTLPERAPAKAIKAELDEMLLYKTEIEIINGR